MSFDGLEPSELFPEVPNLYEFASIHANMLLDKTRVATYRRAIEMAVQEDDVVLDIGTGTGLLAFMAADAGASKVYAVDRVPTVIHWAQELADRNGYSDRVAFITKDSRALALGNDLPDKADVIVSELIGHIAFEEGMIESLFHARDAFLKPNGKIVPQKVQLAGALVNQQAIYENCIDCWGVIGDIDYAPLRTQALKACYLTAISGDDLLSDAFPFVEVDLFSDQPPLLSASNVFEINRKGTVHGLALWFNATLVPSVVLSSSPWAPSTHWKQCFAPHIEPIDVHVGDRIRASVSMRLPQSPSNPFQFSVNLEHLP